MRRSDSHALGSMPAVLPEINLLADLDRFDVEARAGFLQDVEGRSHDLRPDAVAVGDCNRCFVRHGFLVVKIHLSEFER